jgi:hypothetical protein
MKHLITILLLMISLSSFSQSRDQDYYYEEYLYEQYKLEKSRLIWGMVGSAGMGVMSIRSYTIYGDQVSIITSGFGFIISGYSIYKLVKLNREIKEWEKSKKVTG